MKVLRLISNERIILKRDNWKQSNTMESVKQMSQAEQLKRNQSTITGPGCSGKETIKEQR